MRRKSTSPPIKSDGLSTRAWTSTDADTSGKGSGIDINVAPADAARKVRSRPGPGFYGSALAPSSRPVS